METEEQPHHSGGIYNYFQGATINNLVINGNMNKTATDHYDNTQKTNSNTSVTNDQIMGALKECQSMVWGSSAYSVAFCVCRDIYCLQNNASQFERMLLDKGISIASGTINSALYRNPWMKYHVDTTASTHSLNKKLSQIIDEAATEALMEDIRKIQLVMYSTHEPVPLEELENVNKWLLTNNTKTGGIV